MRIVVILLLLCSPLLGSNKIYLKSHYSKLGYIDYTSSRYLYESDVFGLRFGSELEGDGYAHVINSDLSLGVSGRRGQEYFSDRPFYTQIKGTYQYLKDLFYVKNIVLGAGVGGEYNLEGILPGNLNGPGLSWIQVISLSLELYSKYRVSNKKEFLFSVYSPLMGILNRPEWTGTISQEIEELYKEDFLSVLFKRGMFYTPADYRSVTGKLVYKYRLSDSSDLYLENSLTYSYTDIPREFSKLSNRFVFGFNYLTRNY